MKLHGLSWELQLPGKARAKDTGNKYVNKGHGEDFQHYLVEHGKTGGF